MSRVLFAPESGQLSLWPDPGEQFNTPPFSASRSLRDHPSRLRILRMVSYVLRFFPELSGETIKIGVTKGVEGRAVVGVPRIWLNPRGLSYQTIAHELIHVLQGRNGIPSGERSCDIYSVARHHTLVDLRPAYLKIPADAFDVEGRPLPGVAQLLTETAREAVRRREEGRRRYISWFENVVGGRLIEASLIPS